MAASGGCFEVVEIIRDLMVANFEQGSVVTVGEYDGVRGHRTVVAEMHRMAAERDVRPLS